MARTRSRAVVGCLGTVLTACPAPPENPPPGATDGPPPQDSGQPPIEGSICEHVLQPGNDDTAGALALDGVSEGCPEDTSDALRIDWYPTRVVSRVCRSCMYFFPRNLLSEEVKVEYRATANMVGSDHTFDIPMVRPELSYGPNREGTVLLDLQLAATLNVLTTGDVEVHVAARLLRPVETQSVVLTRAVVSIKLDDDGYIYDIDYVEPAP